MKILDQKLALAILSCLDQEDTLPYGQKIKARIALYKAGVLLGYSYQQVRSFYKEFKSEEAN